MEVASGEYDIDLQKAAKTMLQYKPESTSSAWEDVPVISSLSNTLSKFNTIDDMLYMIQNHMHKIKIVNYFNFSLIYL